MVLYLMQKAFFPMNQIEKNYRSIQKTIAKIIDQNNHLVEPPTLIAVTKRRSIEEINTAYQLGINHFGENYLQEAIEKINLFKGQATWHFIGSIQSNKTKLIAKHFDWVHTITRIKVAQKLHEYRTSKIQPLNICIQVKLDDDDTRDSLPINEIPQLIKEIELLQNLKIRGLMGMTQPGSSLQHRDQCFKLLKDAFDDLNQNGYNMNTISLGMSDDYQLAIQNNSNMIRIGTALFGIRKSI